MSKLFTPVSIGEIQLKHRIILAPLTRFRADDQHVPLNLVTEYYAQRASTPGTLLISEGTFISLRAGGNANVPGIYNAEQVRAWRKVTDAVHAKGCYIYCQLWALGRAAKPEILALDGHKLISSGDIPMSTSSPAPEPLDEAGIQAFIKDYADAAKTAIKAGFDGVEIHGANGYLCDQFLQDKCNNRTDKWGGNIKNRSRFGTEVAKAVAAAIGPNRMGYRISPWSPFQGMKMDEPRPQFSELVLNLNEIGLAYLHVVESRISGSETIEARTEQSDFIVDLWDNSRLVILAGGFTAQSAEEAVERYPNQKVAVAFGRHFLANPDLPFRMCKKLPFNDYNRSTFYIPKTSIGYIDYPFSEEFQHQVIATS